MTGGTGTTQRELLISCDESGIGGHNYYGFGSVWMPWDRRGEFSDRFKELQSNLGWKHEVKWSRVSKHNIRTMMGMVDWFFRTKWMSFHCLVVEKARVDKSMHGGDFDLARRKHFTMLLTSKIKQSRRRDARDWAYRVWVDPVHSRYAKASEAISNISNNVLSKIVGRRPVDSVLEKDSKLTPQIQLCDLLLGAVMAAWQRDADRQQKHDLITLIASYLGWPDLDADTYPAQRKFNIWFFHPGPGKRPATTRSVEFSDSVKR